MWAPGSGPARSSAYPMALAPVMKKYIPGHPNLVVSYMPGAGGIKAASYIYGIAPQDGTAWGFITRGFLLAPLLKIPQAQFDPTRFNWIGSPTRTRVHGHGLERLDRGAHHPGRHAQRGGGRRHQHRPGHRHLSARPQPHRRHQVQDRDRLCGPGRGRSRDGARRGAGQGRVHLEIAQQRAERRIGWPTGWSPCWCSSG